MRTIAVAGATGTVGRLVVSALDQAGHRAVRLSRTDGVDITTGHGLRDALEGVDAVIDVLNQFTQSAARARRFFGDTTAALLDAEAAVGVGHHVALSIVGIDAAQGGYYAGKLHQESLVRDATVPWTILRATQFHEFAGQMLHAMTPGPVSLVPRATLRPVAASEVASTLVELAAGEPLREIRQLRGPRDEDLIAMARRVGHGRRVVPVRLPGAMGRAMRDGALRGDDTAAQGLITFNQWMTEQEGTD